MVWDSTWEMVFSSRPWGKYPPESLIRFVARNCYAVEDRSAVRILEIGSGTGANLWYCAREGFSVWGVDGSPTAVKTARERLDRECPGWTGDVLVQDIVHLPFPDEWVDAVIDIEALSCNSFSDARKIVLEAYRVLKKQGRFFSKTFATGCYGEKTGTHVEGNSWIPAVGPLSSIGIVRFTDFSEIEKLYSPFAIETLELEQRSIESRTYEIKEWVIEAVKK